MNATSITNAGSRPPPKTWVSYPGTKRKRFILSRGHRRRLSLGVCSASLPVTPPGARDGRGAHRVGGPIGLVWVPPRATRASPRPASRDHEGEPREVREAVLTARTRPDAVSAHAARATPK